MQELFAAPNSSHKGLCKTITEAPRPSYIIFPTQGWHCPENLSWATSDREKSSKSYFSGWPQNWPWPCDKHIDRTSTQILTLCQAIGTSVFRIPVSKLVLLARKCEHNKDLGGGEDNWSYCSMTWYVAIFQTSGFSLNWAPLKWFGGKGLSPNFFFFIKLPSHSSAHMAIAFLQRKKCFQPSALLGKHCLFELRLHRFINAISSAALMGPSKKERVSLDRTTADC